MYFESQKVLYNYYKVCKDLKKNKALRYFKNTCNPSYLGPIRTKHFEISKDQYLVIEEM